MLLCVFGTQQLTLLSSWAAWPSSLLVSPPHRLNFPRHAFNTLLHAVEFQTEYLLNIESREHISFDQFSKLL